MEKLFLEVTGSELSLSEERIKAAIEASIASRKESLKKVLLIPPDASRLYSHAGVLTNYYYDLLKDTCQVDVLPALGTHMPMDHEEIDLFFGTNIPKDRFLVHNWRNDVVKIGEVPKEFIAQVSDGRMNEKIDVEVNKLLLDKSYDLVISIGQVVPHEVVGLANYSKNIFVGIGGKNMIDKSHMLGAVCNLENIMGRDKTSVRRMFDYAQEEVFNKLNIPLLYVLTVMKFEGDQNAVKGLYISQDREGFTRAAKASQQYNMTFLEKPVKKVVAYLQPEEFKSTWIGNKAVYRSRLAIADEGELIVLAPGVRQFGEDPGNDKLIRKYGYRGDDIIKIMYDEGDLMNNQSVPAHLLHGSSFDRFKIVYAVANMTKEEIEGVNFSYLSYEEAIQKYDPAKLKDGYNTLPDGEEIFYISNPSLGLWASKDKF